MLPTKAKLSIARAINRLLVGARSLVGLSAIARVRRGGLHWELDLNEGVDLAIYLGLYQRIPKRLSDTYLCPHSVVIDIGANIGAHSLPLAKRVGKDGHLIAIEPTKYAFEKLTKNIALNPELSECMITVHAALTETMESGTPENAFYSRWPLRGETRERHAQHLGQFEETQGAHFLTLDGLISDLRRSDKIEGTVTFIKLDVDGNELKVLRGGRETLVNERPIILIEIAPHVQDEVPQRFEQLIDFFAGIGYRLEYSESGKPMPLSAPELRKLIKYGASIDAVARVL